MTSRMLELTRQRPYAMPALLAAACAIAMWLTASAEGLEIIDPDGIGGPPLFRLSAILLVFMMLDVVPRALYRASGHPVRSARLVATVIRERWTGRRLAYVLVGLFSFYITYVAYRNFKGFLPFLAPGINDTTLLELDRALFFGNDPATLLHDLLGTGFANSFLSFMYVIYLGFVPISLAVALVWFGDIRHGLWYAMALCLNWVLGAVSYYMIPAMGPAFVAPELFAELAPSSSSALQHSLWVERLNVLYGSAPGVADEVLQSIAAFASLHTSVTLTAALIASLLRVTRWLRWSLWAYFWIVVVATIYLGWHYVIDDVAGAIIAFLAVWLGAIATGTPLRRAPRPEGSSRGLTLESSAFGGALNVPNVLSAGRIALAPVMAALVISNPQGSIAAGLLFALIAFTDIVDGHIARSRNLVTSLGKLLDPIADKALVIAALVSLVAADRLALWVVAVIAAREVLVTGLRAHAARRGHVLPASASGKAKMGLQVAMVLVLIVVADPAATWVQALVGATVTLTIVSGIACVRAFAAVRTP